MPKGWESPEAKTSTVAALRGLYSYGAGWGFN